MCRRKYCSRDFDSTSSSRCPYAESVKILLEAGCSHRLDEVACWYERTELLNGVPHVVKTYANKLLLWRTELKRIAILYLSDSQCKDLSLDTSAVLDANCDKVIAALQSMDISLDPKLLTRATPKKGASVYHYVSNRKVADLFYDLGFRDLSACTNRLPPPFMNYKRLPYILWLYQHGIDIHKPLEHQILETSEDCRGCWTNNLPPGYTGAHHIAYLFGSVFRHSGKYAKVLAPIILEDVIDSCSCGCSPNGCSPIIAALKGGSRRAIKTCSEASDLAALFSRILDLFDGYVNMGHVISAIRYMTYEAMELPHTCCVSDGWELKVRCDTTEVLEIQDEAADRVERFHQLVESLIKELERVVKGPVISIEAAKDYIGTNWVERMEQELAAEPEESFDELVERTRELGVVWQGPLPPETVDSSPRRTRLTKTQIDSLDFWKDEVDRVMRGEKTFCGV
ncbi:hypothetical protein PG996_014083 [Apiospora saccharicola]|uniref:Ankyrin repeat protein n=1 Tax=Apiospora saccharicola TaxID=335842 RepID=A0ABR1THB1_9PEZI